MGRIRLGLLAALLLPTALWLLADSLVPQPFGYFAFRAAFVQFSGVLAATLMGLAMLLALRPRWLEPHVGGLDKMYRLHKWYGIGALVFALLHWWWAKGTKWMVGWGWLERPARRPPAAAEAAGTIEAWLRSQRGLAEGIGEWAFYAFVVLVVLALAKRFPYHLFAKTHRWIAVAFLALAYHSVVLAKPVYWAQPVGWLLAIVLLGGVVATMATLFGRIGAGRKVRGEVSALTEYPALRVLETGVVLEPGWPGHAAGQFAFVTTDRKEGAHPYTIASSWNPVDRRIVFITKALGDHTSRLHALLQVGTPVMVEGPYGCFDFDDEQPRQIWIGAGIGITPFIARLKQRAVKADGKAIDLFHPTAEFEQAAIDRLTADAAAAGVRLHVLVSPRDGVFDGERIRALVPEWRSASLWFCGPPKYGQALRKDFLGQGLASRHFHQELFQMR